VSKIRKDVLGEAARSALLGIIPLAIVFLTPDAGRPIGRSFVRVAFDASWRDLGDVAAAWCGLKILLLSFGAVMLTDAVSKVMEAMRHEALAVAASFAALVPLSGLALGFYEVLKALL
jgi:hypothetical protein